MTGGGGRGVIAATSAPSPAHVGQRWFNTATAVTYQYTIDAAGTKFWLDISSGGIGTSASRGVDWVGDTDPHLETNGSGLAVGDVYYNREADRYFTCTTATTNSNVWAGRYAGSGGVETVHKNGSDFFRIHTFTTDGTFILESTTTCDILMIAGGGGGKGVYHGAGGGAGGFVYYSQKSSAAGSYSIGIGAKGSGGTTPLSAYDSTSGGNTTFTGLTTAVGGGYGGRGGNYDISKPAGGGSGGGAGDYNTTNNRNKGGANTLYQGNLGGDCSSSQTTWQGTGGGGGAGSAGGLGTGPSSSNNGDGGDGGAGKTTGDTVYNFTAGGGATVTFPANFTNGSSSTSYCGGGGGGGNNSGGAATHGGGAGSTGGGADATTYGSGGGGSARQGSPGNYKGGDGYQGVVIIRYQINA